MDPGHDAMAAAVSALHLDRMGHVGEVLGTVIDHLVCINQQLETRVCALEKMAAFGLEPMSTDEVAHLSDDLLPDLWLALAGPDVGGGVQVGLNDKGGANEVPEPVV